MIGIVISAPGEKYFIMTIPRFLEITYLIDLISKTEKFGFKNLKRH